MGGWGEGGESLQIYTNSIIHLKDREACADSIDPNQMSQSVPSDLFATIQQFFRHIRRVKGCLTFRTIMVRENSILIFRVNTVCQVPWEDCGP